MKNVDLYVLAENWKALHGLPVFDLAL